MNTRELTIRMRPDEKAPRITRSHLAGMRSSLEPRFDDALLVLSELVTNSVRHGRSDRDIEVVVRATDSDIKLQVSDGGEGFDGNGNRGEGLGLVIVEKVAEDWGIRTHQGFTVWVEMSKAASAV